MKLRSARACPRGAASHPGRAVLRWRFARSLGVPAALALLGVIGAVGSAFPQSAAFELGVDNDAFTSWIPWRANSDREYTHGLWLAAELQSAPGWGRLVGSRAGCVDEPGEATTCLQTRFELGQKIFTPDIEESPPPADERPYAGWLYGAMTTRFVSGRTRRGLRLELGVTGPPSLAEHFQRVVHRLTGYPTPRGWDGQVDFAPGIGAKYDEEHTFEHRNAAGIRTADAVVGGNLTVGNVWSGLEGSLTARVGSALPNPWGQPEDREGTAVYGFTRIEGTWGWNDLFLEGSTRRAHARVERRALGGTLELGAAVEHGRLRVGYSLTWQDRLYETQPSPHLFSTILIGVRPGER